MSAAETFDPWADLDQHMTDGLPDYVEDAEPPTLATVDEIERTLRRLRVAHDRLHEAEEVAKANVEAVQSWLHDRSSVLLREIDWHTQAVERWHRAHVREGGTKTVSLPSGVLKLSKARTTVEALGVPADDAPEALVRVRREWSKVDVARATTPGPVAEDIDQPEGKVAHYAVTADGEVLGDVVLLVPVADTFKVTVSRER